MPTTLVGLLLFVVLLAPGFCYVLRKELARGSRTISPFRETVTLAVISLGCDAAVGAAFGMVRILLPSRTQTSGHWFAPRQNYVRGHYASLAWWGLSLLTAACLFGVALASTEIGSKAAAALRRIRGLRWLAPPRTLLPSILPGGDCSTSTRTVSSTWAATSTMAASSPAGFSAMPRTTTRPVIGGIVKSCGSRLA